MVRAEGRAARPGLELDFNRAARPLCREDARKEQEEEPKELPPGPRGAQTQPAGAEVPMPAFHCCTSLRPRNHTHVQAKSLMPDVYTEQSRLFHPLEPTCVRATDGSMKPHFKTVSPQTASIHHSHRTYSHDLLEAARPEHSLTVRHKG